MLVELTKKIDAADNMAVVRSMKLYAFALGNDDDDAVVCLQASRWIDLHAYTSRIVQRQMQNTLKPVQFYLYQF